ncbi:MAG: ABC transporter ATP-binding protein [Thermoplasmata archaeon]|nr:ABC transporter ATP-binding protein [Thermoplasmata archaeon]MCI4362370.1 ABC transporter ATP-binding protein [Thermoplasmata archaeon]
MTDPGAPGLTVTGLTVRYRTLTALHGISLGVRPGEVLALAGPNGSGKTSFVRAVVGLAPVAEGRVEFGGRALASLSLEERARTIAWMPQEEPVGDNVPLREYVLYGRYPHSPRFAPVREQDRVIADRLLTELGFSDRAHVGIQELSGGERQRVRLGRVLAQETPVLLLDEPTAHLDMGHQLDLLERVRRLAHVEGRAVVAALHDLNLAARYADRVVVLQRGRIVADGLPSTVLSPALLRDVWGVTADLRTDPRTGLPYLIPRLIPADLRPSASPPFRRVHVVGGGGSATPILRALTAEGHRVTLGVVALFDSDAETAAELDVPVVAEIPFAPLGEEARAKNRDLLNEAEVIVVAPFPIGPGNLPVLEDVLDVAGRVPTYLVESPTPSARDFTGGLGASRLAALRPLSRVIANERELLRALAAPTPSTGADAHDADRGRVRPLERLEESR